MHSLTPPGHTATDLPGGGAWSVSTEHLRERNPFTQKQFFFAAGHAQQSTAEQQAAPPAFMQGPTSVPGPAAHLPFRSSAWKHCRETGRQPSHHHLCRQGGRGSISISSRFSISTERGAVGVRAAQQCKTCGGRPGPSPSHRPQPLRCCGVHNRRWLGARSHVPHDGRPEAGRGHQDASVLQPSRHHIGRVGAEHAAGGRRARLGAGLKPGAKGWQTACGVTGAMQQKMSNKHEAICFRVKQEAGGACQARRAAPQDRRGAGAGSHSRHCKRRRGGLAGRLPCCRRLTRCPAAARCGARSLHQVAAGGHMMWAIEAGRFPSVRRCCGARAVQAVALPPCTPAGRSPITNGPFS